MKQNSKEEQKMEMFIGVVLPILLIVIANKLQANYKSQQDEKMYKQYVSRFTNDVMKQIKELSAPKE